MPYMKRRPRSKPMRADLDDTRESEDGWLEVPVTLADGLQEKHIFAPRASVDHTCTSKCWCRPVQGVERATRMPVFLHRENRPKA